MQLALNNLYQSSLDLKMAVAMGVMIFAIIIAILWYSAPDAGRKKTSKKTFRRRAISLGLTKSQTRLLESFLGRIREPSTLLVNTRELNRTLAEALRDCSDSRDVENNQMEIYRIKQCIDRVHADRGSMTSSRQLKINQKINFQQEDGERSASWITANLKEFYCVGIPKDLEGKSWRKGSRIRLFILSIDGEEIVFESRVLGYTSIMGLPSVILKHATRENRSSIRRHRRRATGCRVILYPVRIAEKGQIPAASHSGLAGTLIDLSPGGCSVSSRNSPGQGGMVKLVFEYKAGENVVVFGKIVNTRVIDRSKSVIHIMFTQAAIEDMNLINSYVYELC